MAQLYAQPYDISTTGFYFETEEEYKKSVNALRNEYGDPVEEFEIQFIDGDAIDCDLANAIGLNQANLARFFEIIDEWEEWEKQQVILAVGECGYQFDNGTAPDDFDVDIYGVTSMRELAEQFVEEGLFGDIPERLQFYIDYDAIARDLAVDYSEAVVANSRVIYRCG
ncbi:MAG: antirestriction protein ArdA [Rhodobacteraceae bacterium]|nr:MAG: antirestriction protein ArdA [Paracoccaceae bacterium]